jgi:hypothetical protein
MDMHRHLSTEVLRDLCENYARLAQEEYKSWQFYQGKAAAASLSLSSRAEKLRVFDVLFMLGRDGALGIHEHPRQSQFGVLRDGATILPGIIGWDSF